MEILNVQSSEELSDQPDSLGPKQDIAQQIRNMWD
jgi:hypothetical protein